MYSQDVFCQIHSWLIIKDEFVVTDKANANKDAKEEAKAVKAAEKKAPAISLLRDPLDLRL